MEGNISFSTAEPVEQEQALPILETLLGWTHNALVRRGSGYVVMPAKDAVAGNLVLSLGVAAPGGGLQARLFPLRYVSATEMQKLIKPFVGKDAVLLADPSRNLIVLAGTPQELADDERMIRTFDVDWLRGTSVGVFNLQYARVGELMPKLDGLFGEHGSTPLAGMLRFIPIERTNALVVISTQPDYLREVGELDRQDPRRRWRQPAAAVRLRRAQPESLPPGQESRRSTPTAPAAAATTAARSGRAWPAPPWAVPTTSTRTRWAAPPAASATPAPARSVAA
ncbi:hypothetical protein RLIN73S_00362 [Rhodanobacter lindaniclasticus]